MESSGRWWEILSVANIHQGGRGTQDYRTERRARSRKQKRKRQKERESGNKMLGRSSDRNVIEK